MAPKKRRADLAASWERTAERRAAEALAALRAGAVIRVYLGPTFLVHANGRRELMAHQTFHKLEHARHIVRAPTADTPEFDEWHLTPTESDA